MIRCNPMHVHTLLIAAEHSACQIELKRSMPLSESESKIKFVQSPLFGSLSEAVAGCPASRFHSVGRIEPGKSRREFFRAHGTHPGVIQPHPTDSQQTVS